MSTTVHTRAGTPVAITAVPPARAVRRSIIDATLTFSIGDEGGRGRPWMALFVPVRETAGDRFEVDPPGPPDAGTLGRIRYRMTAADANESPFTYRFRRDDGLGNWLQGSAGTLTLLLYPQADFDLTDDDLPQDTLAGDFWRGVWTEIAGVLAGSSRLLLETCRVVLSPGEQAQIGPAPQTYALAATRSRSRGAPAAPPPTDRRRVTFALASCQYPGDFLDRSPDFATPGLEGPADASVLRLRRRIDTPGAIGRPQFLILCGDQVYVDATAGLFDPALPDDRFRVAYANYSGSLGMRRLLVALSSVYALFDDHEVADNWAMGDAGDIEGAVAAYWREQRAAGLPPKDPQDLHVLWAEFEREGIDFFLADTRCQREQRRAGDFERARIMSEAQWKDLQAFIERTRSKGLAFVASPSMLLPRHLSLAHDPESALRSDSWEGYPCSFKRLLAFMCDGGHDHVVFLSGDEHVSCHAKATVRRGAKSATFHSVHSSALYAPYPFANSIDDDFAHVEEFHFRLSERGPLYSCAVESSFPPPGDGFALIRVGFGDEGGPRIEVHFDKGDAPAAQADLLLRPGPVRVR